MSRVQYLEHMSEPLSVAHLSEMDGHVVWIDRKISGGACLVDALSAKLITAHGWWPFDAVKDGIIKVYNYPIDEFEEKAIEKLTRIAKHYGKEKQLCKLIEELGEATAAASEVQMLLCFGEDSGKKENIQKRLEHLVAELGDVMNLTEQIIYLFSLMAEFSIWRNVGIDKTIKRIEAEAHERENNCDMSE